jgi:hypothetical protein
MYKELTQLETIDEQFYDKWEDVREDFFGDPSSDIQYMGARYLVGDTTFLEASSPILITVADETETTTLLVVDVLLALRECLHPMKCKKINILKNEYY